MEDNYNNDNSNYNEETPYQPQITNQQQDYPPQEYAKQGSFNQDQEYQPQIVNYEEQPMNQNEQYQEYQPQQAGNGGNSNPSAMDNIGNNAFFTLLRQKMDQYQMSLPECNFSLALIMMLLFPAIAQLADEVIDLFDIMGSFLFFLWMVWSIITMWAWEKQNKIWILLYRNIQIIYCISFLILFILSIIDLAREKYKRRNQVGNDVIMLIFSLPFSIWTFFSFMLCRDKIKSI